MGEEDFPSKVSDLGPGSLKSMKKAFPPSTSRKRGSLRWSLSQDRKKR